MNKKEELEILLSQTLKEKTEEIQFKDNLILNVRERILLSKKGGNIVMKLKIMPLWKKAVAAVVIAALTLGVALGVSPSAKAIANDALIKLGVITMKVVEEGKDFIVLKGTDDKGNEVGMSIRKFDGNNSEEIAIKGHTQKFSSLEEAEKYLGMQIKLPSYLPEGYKLHGMLGDKGDKGVSKYFSATFINEQNNQLKTIWLRIDPALPSLTNISRNAEKVNINGTTGYWIEKEVITFSSDENSDKKMSEKLKTAKRYELYWQFNGLTYHLSGQDLTKEEAVKMAESIR
ncbi:MAG: DUF4367 domain-containing protein [Minisyncoccia bacterium]